MGLKLRFNPEMRIYLFLILVLFALNSFKIVFAQSAIEFFDFEDGTFQGWKFTQRDKQGISDIGTYFYGCRDAYPFELSPNGGKGGTKGVKIGPEREFDAYVCRVGISKNFIVSSKSDIIISFDARTKSSSPNSTVSNVELLVYGGSEIPKDFDNSGIPYYNPYTEYENPWEIKMLFPPFYGKGDYDSGWRNYKIRINSQENSEITFFINTHDHWMANWDKELYLDNIKIIDIGAICSIILEIEKIVNQLSSLLFQYSQIIKR
jgi:hypothetical protein